jgi:hypothetical protein
MPKAPRQRSFDEVLDGLRSVQFDVRPVPNVANQMRVSKYGCAAVLAPESKGAGVAMAAKPGVLFGDEIAYLVDHGFQKFFKTSRGEFPATADHLRGLHRFSEELKEISGSVSLYNESLGSVSAEYMYDRVKGRDLPESQRPIPAWELPAGH